LLLKFLPPETIAAFGGAARFAQAVDDALDGVAELLARPAEIARLLGRI
jgi:hypothetical protein